MRVFHVTPSRNRTAIGVGGINPAYSQGARKECWFVTHGKLAWAFLHVARRHGVPVDEVVALEVLIDPEDLTYRGGGKFSCARLIPAIFITDVHDVADVAGSRPFDHAPEKLDA